MRLPQRSSSAARLAAAACLAVLIGPLVGCSTLSDVRYTHTQKRRTHQAWHCFSKNAQCPPGCDYRDGWKAGYYDVLTGGCGDPPLVAPKKYWRPTEVLGECDKGRQRWYVGYQDGAAAAKQCPDTHYLKLWMPPATCRKPAGCPVGPGPMPGEDIRPISAPALRLNTPLPAPIEEDDEADDDAEDTSDATDNDAAEKKSADADEKSDAADDETKTPTLDMPTEETPAPPAEDKVAPAKKPQSFRDRIREMAKPDAPAEPKADDAADEPEAEQPAPALDLPSDDTSFQMMPFDLRGEQLTGGGKRTGRVVTEVPIEKLPIEQDRVVKPVEDAVKSPLTERPEVADVTEAPASHSAAAFKLFAGSINRAAKSTNNWRAPQTRPHPVDALIAQPIVTDQPNVEPTLPAIASEPVRSVPTFNLDGVLPGGAKARR